VIDRVNEQRRLALVCLFDQQQVFFVDGGSGGRQAIEAHNVDAAIGIAPEREFLEGNETGKCSHGGNLLLLDGQLFSTSSRERDSDKLRREPAALQGPTLNGLQIRREQPEIQWSRLALSK
jgi:hypothetical protein